MAGRVSAPLLTPSLLRQTFTLHAELADVVERSRDLCWWARHLHGGAVHPGRRRLCGGALDDDGPVGSPPAPQSDALITVLILDHPMCPDCIAAKANISHERVGAYLQRKGMAFTLQRRRDDRCRVCGGIGRAVSVSRAGAT